MRSVWCARLPFSVQAVAVLVPSTCARCRPASTEAGYSARAISETVHSSCTSASFARAQQSEAARVSSPVNRRSRDSWVRASDCSPRETLSSWTTAPRTHVRRCSGGRRRESCRDRGYLAATGHENECRALNKEHTTSTRVRAKRFKIYRETAVRTLRDHRTAVTTCQYVCPSPPRLLCEKYIETPRSATSCCARFGEQHTHKLLKHYRYVRPLIK